VSREPLAEGSAETSSGSRLTAHGPGTLVQGVLAGRARDIGRAISAVEVNGGAPEITGPLFARTGRARVLGITGPPGAGKSTLVLRLAQALRRRGKTVGIVAVDPSSPFTGGAILGDRIRMTEI
jgi:LAO/AO transport system kinase